MWGPREARNVKQATGPGPRAACFCSRDNTEENLISLLFPSRWLSSSVPQAPASQTSAQVYSRRLGLEYASGEPVNMLPMGGRGLDVEDVDGENFPLCCFLAMTSFDGRTSMEDPVDGEDKVDD